jgi:hypothetical protein
MTEGNEMVHEKYDEEERGRRGQEEENGEQDKTNIDEVLSGYQPGQMFER